MQLFPQITYVLITKTPVNVSIAQVYNTNAAVNKFNAKKMKIELNLLI